jgi:multidrug efflux pump subunit AcrA (membrane-fusion protein)
MLDLQTLEIKAAIATLAAAALLGVGAYGGYRFERGEYQRAEAAYSQLESAVRDDGAKAKAALAATESNYAAALRSAESQHAQDQLALEYLRSHPVVRVRVVHEGDPGGGAVRASADPADGVPAAPGQPGSGDADSRSVDVSRYDPAFVEACGRDALTVLEIQDWAKHVGLWPAN